MGVAPTETCSQTAPDWSAAAKAVESLSPTGVLNRPSLQVTLSVSVKSADPPLDAA